MIRFTGLNADLCSEWVTLRQKSGKTARLVRGNHMRNLDALFSEWSAALQFPDYFGFNWPAFAECNGDPDWLDLEQGVVVIITHAHEMLSEESAEIPTLYKLITQAIAELAEPIAQGQPWDRPAVQFTVILQMEGVGTIPFSRSAPHFKGDLANARQSLDNLVP